MTLIRFDAPAQEMDQFSMAQARHIVKDFFAPSAAIFWTDFLLSFGLGAFCYNRSLNFIVKGQAFAPLQILCFLVACALFYRSVLFIHELVHLRTGTFTAFRAVWNLFCGIPMLVPSFLYYTHLDHHRRNHYGTVLDGEYIPLGSQSRGAILVYLLQPLIIPVLAIFRFMILTPLTWFIPPVRNWVFEHASSMIMEPKYVRPYPTAATLRVWRLQEFGCLVWCWGVAILLYRGLQPGVTVEMFDRPLLNGVLPIQFLFQAYATGIVILYVNALRTLGAHRFMNDGSEMTFSEQLIDSVNFVHWPLISGIWAPVGLRFHALHHLFPSLPYHQLAKAHAKLMQELPANNLYRRTNATSLFGVLWGLWQSAKEAEQRHTESVKEHVESNRHEAVMS